MPLPTRLALRFEQTTDRQTNQLQENANRTTSAVNACPFINGLVLSHPDATGKLNENIAFSATTTIVVTHKLGRKPTGFIVIGAYSGNPTLTWDPTLSTDKTIRLYSTDACTYRLWVF